MRSRAEYRWRRARADGERALLSPTNLSVAVPRAATARLLPRSGFAGAPLLARVMQNSLSR